MKKHIKAKYSQLLKSVKSQDMLSTLPLLKEVIQENVELHKKAVVNQQPIELILIKEQK